MMTSDKERFWLQKCIEAFRSEDFDALLKDAIELERCGGDADVSAMYRGIALFHKKMFKDARHIFYQIFTAKMAMEKKRDDAVLYYISLCDLHSGRLPQAIMILEKLEEAHPECIEYKIMLYLAYQMDGDMVSSSAILAEALAMDDLAATRTLEGMMMKAFENSQLSRTAKVMLIEMVRKLRKG